MGRHKRRKSIVRQEIDGPAANSHLHEHPYRSEMRGEKLLLFHGRSFKEKALNIDEKRRPHGSNVVN